AVVVLGRATGGAADAVDPGQRRADRRHRASAAGHENEQYDLRFIVLPTTHHSLLNYGGPHVTASFLPPASSPARVYVDGSFAGLGDPRDFGIDVRAAEIGRAHV